MASKPRRCKSKRRSTTQQRVKQPVPDQVKVVSKTRQTWDEFKQSHSDQFDQVRADVDQKLSAKDHFTSEELCELADQLLSPYLKYRYKHTIVCDYPVQSALQAERKQRREVHLEGEPPTGGSYNRAHPRGRGLAKDSNHFFTP